MKKTKLLTSLAALALVVSLGGCDQPSEDDSIDESTETTETTESSETSESDVDYGDPVADLFDAIENEPNFTLELYYYELTSDYYSTKEEAQEAGYEYYTEADVIITYTKDAVVLEYYIYDTFLDCEAYVNDYDDAVYESDLTLYFDLEDGVLTNTWYGWYGTWEEILDSPLALLDYQDAFTKGDTTEGKYGTEIDYEVDLSVDGLFDTLIADVFTAENWLVGYYVAGPLRVQSIHDQGYSYYDIASTYYADYDEWHIDMETYDMTWSGTLYGTPVSWIEYDFMEAAIYDVGTTVIDSSWADDIVLG